MAEDNEYSKVCILFIAFIVLLVFFLGLGIYLAKVDKRLISFSLDAIPCDTVNGDDKGFSYTGASISTFGINFFHPSLSSLCSNEMRNFTVKDKTGPLIERIGSYDSLILEANQTYNQELLSAFTRISITFFSFDNSEL